MSAEIDVPFTNPDAFTGGGNFLTPADVFAPTTTPLESFLQVTGASESQAAAVQDSLNNFGQSVKNVFSDIGNFLKPSNVKITDKIGTDSSPSSSDNSQTSSNGLAQKAQNSYNGLLKNVLKGGVVVGGSAGAIGAGLSFLGNSAANIDKQFGLPSGSSLIFIGLIVFLILMMVLSR